MTTSDDGSAAGGRPGRRQPGRSSRTSAAGCATACRAAIRTARGQLIVLAAYLLLAPIIIGILWRSAAALAKINLGAPGHRRRRPSATWSWRSFASSRPGCCCGVRCSATGWRSRWPLCAAAGSYAIYRVISGDQNLAGDPGFFFVIYQGVHVVLGVAIAYNLLASIGQVRQMATEPTGPARTSTSTCVISGSSPGPRRPRRSRPARSPRTRPTRRPSRRWSSAAPVAARSCRPATGGVEPLLAVRGLKKHFPIVGGMLRRQIGTVYAVDGVDFDVYPGEIFSLVGESGCGKTTLGRTVLQLTPPTAGKVVFDGYELADVDPDDMRPLRRRMQIIFQDPFGSLNPRMPVSDIIGEGLLAQGVKDRKERDKRVEDSLEIVGLRRDYTRRYPHEFSGGQRQRIGIARALALGPDLIVCDEPVSALDVSIQSQVLNLLLDLRRDFNLTYLFISHNLSVVQYFSDRVGVMYLGKLVEEGAVEQLYRDPRHPYTVALLSAIPDADPRRRKKRLVLKGDVPSPAAPPSGCRFHTRCWLYEKLGNPERCVTEEPLLRDRRRGRPSDGLPLRRGGQRNRRGVGRGTQSVIETAVAEPA